MDQETQTQDLKMDREIVSTGVNEKGNKYTKYSENDYRYDNLNGKFFSLHSLEKASLKPTPLLMVKLDGLDPLMKNKKMKILKTRHHNQIIIYSSFRSIPILS